MDTAVAPQVGETLRSTVDLVIGFGSDFLAFIVVAALIAAFAFYFGRDRLAPLIAGLYAASMLYLNFPYTDMLKGDAYLGTGLFVFLTVVGLVAFSGLAGFMASTGTGLLKVLALSAIAAGLVLAVAINILPVPTIYAFSPATLALFSHSYFFWWLAAPLAGVLVLSR